MRETEAKFVVPEDFQLPALEGLPRGVESSPPKDRDIETVYYDTDDLRLTRWGCSLRYRTREGWTVKLPISRAEQLLVRSEIPIRGARAAPPPQALDLLTAYLRGSSVAPIARLRTRRRNVGLHDASGTVVAQVMDDRVTVLSDRRELGRFREIEVELGDAAPSNLIEVLRKRLVPEGAASTAAQSKVARALGDRANEPPDVYPPSIGPDSTTGDVIRAAVGSSLRRLIVHDAGVRLGEDPEAVHQARVAIRRLRSDLSTFGSHLANGWGEALRTELRSLGHELGAVRDADVLSSLLARLGKALGGADTPAVAKLLRRLDRQRDEVRDRLLASLRAVSYGALLDRLVSAARAPALTADAEEPAAQTLPTLLAAPWASLAKAARKAGDNGSDEALHQVRIRAKRFRYAAEALSPVLGKKVRALAKASSDLQDVLGSLQDAVTAQAWLRDEASGGGPGFAAGELTVMLRDEAQVARKRWPKAWTKLAKKAPS